MPTKDPFDDLDYEPLLPPPGFNQLSPDSNVLVSEVADSALFRVEVPLIWSLDDMLAPNWEENKARMLRDLLQLYKEAIQEVERTVADSLQVEYDEDGSSTPVQAADSEEN